MYVGEEGLRGERVVGERVVGERVVGDRVVGKRVKVGGIWIEIGRKHG